MSYSVALNLTPVRQGFSLNLELGWWPTRLEAPPLSALHGTEVPHKHVTILGSLHGC